MVRRHNADLLSVAPLSMLFFTLNIALYGYCAYHSGSMNIDPGVMLQMGASMRERLWDGDWLRLIMPNFLHWSLLHIALNNYYLYQRGPAAELHFGSANFGTLYLLSGIAGFCFSQIFGGHFSAGASASLFGILGAEFCVLVLQCPRLKYAWRSREVRVQAAWIGVFFLLGISGFMGPVDNWGHLGGFLTGTLLAGFFEVWRTRHRLGLASVAGVLLLIALPVCAARWSFFQPDYHVQLAIAAHEKGETLTAQAEAAEARKWALFWHTEDKTGLLLASGFADRWTLAEARTEGFNRLYWRMLWVSMSN